MEVKNISGVAIDVFRLNSDGQEVGRSAVLLVLASLECVCYHFSAFLQHPNVESVFSTFPPR